MDEWAKEMGIVYEALTTGGQEIYVEDDLSRWAGIHVLPGEEVTFQRAFTFTIKGPELDAG